MDEGAASVAVSWDPIRAEDEFDGPGAQSVQQEEGKSSGDQFPVGETRQQYAAIDAAGNRAECVFTVTVLGKKILISL